MKGRADERPKYGADLNLFFRTNITFTFLRYSVEHLKSTLLHSSQRFLKHVLSKFLRDTPK